MGPEIDGAAHGSDLHRQPAEAAQAPDRIKGRPSVRPNVEELQLGQAAEP